MKITITKTVYDTVCSHDEVIVRSANPSRREQKLFARMSEIDQTRSTLNFSRDYYYATQLQKERCRIKQQLRDLGVRFLKPECV